MDGVVTQLRSAVAGQVLAPADDGFDGARRVYYGGYDRRPAAIVRVAGVDDVRAVIGVARSSGLELVVRGGGHSVAGHSATEGGIVLDMRGLRDLRIDPSRREAVAQPGLTAAAYTAAVGEHGLATGFGDYGGVGIGGITLGGGVGFLARLHGLTIDSLLGAEVVTAAGEVLTVDETHHPDLFWALRGGGGNFGVATRFTYRLHEVPTVVGGMLMLPMTAAAIEEFVALADEAPEELSAIANIMRLPPMPFVPPDAVGQFGIMAMMCFAGPVEAAEKALAPFRALAEPIVDMLAPMPYPAIYEGEEPAADDQPQVQAAAHTMFVGGVDAAAAQTIVERLADPSVAMGVTQLRVLGGAVSRVPASATAYWHRASKVMVNVAALCGSAEEVERAKPWVADVARALHTGDDGAYVNFLGDEGDARVRAAYPPPVWERLARVKATYDPDNLFHRNGNIPPART